MNALVRSFPQLQPYVPTLLTGYQNYLAGQGNALLIANPALPPAIANFLRGHYASPPRDLAHIKRIREESGVSTCPMCGSFHGGTLDHVLPKSDHPAFAIFGPNLVPACKCNSRRSANLTGANPGERILHPYFDDVLGQRILAAHFDDLGLVPEISLDILLAPADPLYAAVQFHVANVVERNDIRRYLGNTWPTFLRRPSNLVMELRHNPTSRADLVGILERQLDRLDEFYGSKNNWNSVFVAGLLKDEVVDWLHHRLSLPGRVPDAPLLT